VFAGEIVNEVNVTKHALFSFFSFVVI